MSYPLKHDLPIWEQVDLYPAARITLAERKGTLAWTVVPFSGCESTENVPFTSLKRCSILIRPSPASPCRFEVKTSARVANRKMNLIVSPQLHAELLYPAVLHPVVQRFL